MSCCFWGVHVNRNLKRKLEWIHSVLLKSILVQTRYAYDALDGLKTLKIWLRF